MGDILVIEKTKELEVSKKNEIDAVINKAIEQHKKNGAMINQLTLDSVTALTASQSRAKELGEQGFIKRFWNNLTGKNQKLQASIDADMISSQYASQQIIQKLAEQNLMTFDLVTSVNNKLNTLVLEMDEEINQIYQILNSFFKQTRSHIIQTESRLDKLERNVELLHWSSTIEYRVYRDREYQQLEPLEKMICLTNDFYNKTKGVWSTADLMLLKTTCANLGLNIHDSVSLNTVIDYLIEHPTLIQRLFEEIPLDGLDIVTPYEVPTLKGIQKLEKINGEEKYILDTIVEQLEDLGAPYDKRKIQLNLIHHYLQNTAYHNANVELNQFDFIVELLVNLKQIAEAKAINGQEILIELNEDDEEGKESLEFNQIEEQIKRGKFESKEEYRKRINRLDPIPMGQLYFIAEDYDPDTGAAPYQIEWNEWFKNSDRVDVLVTDRAKLSIPPKEMREIVSQGNEWECYATLGIVDQVVYLKNVTVTINEKTYLIDNLVPKDEIKFFERHDDIIRIVRFSKDGKFLATGSDDHKLKIWELESGKVIKEIKENSEIRALSFAKHQDLLAIGLGNGIIKILDTNNWEILRDRYVHSHQKVSSITFFNNDDKIVSTGWDHEVVIWDINESKIVKDFSDVITYHSNRVYSVDVSPDGKLIASGNKDGEIVINNLKNNEEEIIGEHDGWVKAVCFSNDGRLLATGSEDATVKIWDTTTWRLIKTLEDHDEMVQSIKFSANDNLLYTASDDQTIKIWDVRTGKVIETISKHTDFVMVVDTLSDHLLIASGSNDNCVGLFGIKVS